MPSEEIVKRKSSQVRTLLFLAILSLSGALLAVNLQVGPSRRILQGKIEPVRMEDLVLNIMSPGVVEPEVVVSVKNEVGGNIAAKYVREGDVVKANQVLLEFSMVDAQMELERRKSQLVQTGKDLEKARENFKDSRQLLKQRAITKRDFAESQQVFERAQEAAALARKDFEGQEKKASQSKIPSPIDGIILSDKVGSNGWVGAGQELFIIGQLDKFHVRAKVDELDISKIRPGQRAEIRLEAFPDAVFPGEVTKIGAEAQQGAFAEVDVFVDMKDLRGVPVKPNLSAKVSFFTGQIAGALTIPLGCVQYQGNDNYVRVISRRGALSLRKVTLGQSSNGRVIVLEGLKAGENALLPQEETSDRL